jgi:hypothetical protein
MKLTKKILYPLLAMMNSVKINIVLLFLRIAWYPLVRESFWKLSNKILEHCPLWIDTRYEQDQFTIHKWDTIIK